jgi:hypothetical protein
MVSAPFRHIRKGFLGNSLQTRRSFLHVAAKISPMPTVSTKFCTDSQFRSFLPEKVAPHIKIAMENHMSCKEIAKT